MGEETRRIAPLEGCGFDGEEVRVLPAEPATRLVLRAPAEACEALSAALGLDLPRKPKTTSSRDARAALWLGPDEWLVIDQAGANLVAACAGVPAFHSAVDVSHRNTAMLLSGPRAEDVLSSGCPQDLSLHAFPVGAASRTVFGKAEIVLWRTGEDAFRLECWRSFSDYVLLLMEAAARDV